MKTTKLALVAVAVLLVALLAGYLWGASGRRAADRELEAAALRTELLESRDALLTARLDVYNVNFGDASRHFEEAKAPLRRARERYQQIGKNAAAGSLAAALEHVDEGQRLAGALDQAANTKASDALQAIKVAASQ